MTVVIEIQECADTFAEVSDLHGWLSGQFGAVSLVESVRDPEGMGWAADAVTVAVGNGGAMTALAGSLATWLVSRRTRVRIKVTGSDGRSYEMEASGNRAAVEAVLRQALEDRDGGGT